MPDNPNIGSGKGQLYSAKLANNLHSTRSTTAIQNIQIIHYTYTNLLFCLSLVIYHYNFCFICYFFINFANLKILDSHSVPLITFFS